MSGNNSNSGSEFFSNFEGFLRKFKLTTENDKARDQEIFNLAHLDSGYIRRFIVKKVDETALFRRSVRNSLSARFKRKDKKPKGERRSSNGSVKNAFGFKTKSSNSNNGHIKRSRSELTLSRKVSNGSISSCKSDGGVIRKKKHSLGGRLNFKIGWNSSSESDTEITPAMTAKDSEEKDDPGFSNPAYVKDNFEDEGIGGLGKEDKEEKDRSDGDGTSETESSISSLETSSPNESPRFNLKMSPRPKRKAKKKHDGQNSPVSFRSGYQSNRSSISSARKGILKKSTSSTTINMEMANLSRPQTPTECDDDEVSNGDPPRLVRTATLNRVKFILDSGKPDNITGDYDDIKMEKGERERNDRSGKQVDKEDSRGLSKSGKKCLVFSAGVLIVTMAVILGSFFGSRKTGLPTKTIGGGAPAIIKNHIENALEGKFRIINEDFAPYLYNFESPEFKKMSTKLEETMVKVIFLEESVNLPNSTTKLKIVKFEEGSVISIFRIKWEGVKTLTLPAIRKRVSAHLNQYGAFGDYKVERASFSVTELRDLCDAVSCSHICDLSEDTLRFGCSCPDSLILVNNTNCISPTLTTTAKSLAPLFIPDAISKVLQISNAKIVRINQETVSKDVPPKEDEKEENKISDESIDSKDIPESESTLEKPEVTPEDNKVIPSNITDSVTKEPLSSQNNDTNPESALVDTVKTTEHLLLNSSDGALTTDSTLNSTQITPVSLQNSTLTNTTSTALSNSSSIDGNAMAVHESLQQMNTTDDSNLESEEPIDGTEGSILDIDATVDDDMSSLSTDAPADSSDSIIDNEPLVLPDINQVNSSEPSIIQITSPDQNINTELSIKDESNDLSTETVTLEPDTFNDNDDKLNEVSKTEFKSIVVSEELKPNSTSSVAEYILNHNETTTVLQSTTISSAMTISSVTTSTPVLDKTTEKVVTIEIIPMIEVNNAPITIKTGMNESTTDTNNQTTSSPSAISATTSLNESANEANPPIGFDVIADASHDLSIPLPIPEQENKNELLARDVNDNENILSKETANISISTTAAEAICDDEQFKCSNLESNYGTCIPISARCNSVPDCYDESDEKECIESKCFNNYQCRWSGDCLDKKFVCDGIKHCTDGDDEEGCDTWTCAKDEFKCDPGSYTVCIPLTLKCDGHSDCFGGTDEVNCTSECSNDQFLCPEGKCIPNIWKCDNTKDCIGGEDELDCGCEGLDQTKCVVGGCVPTFKLCDGLRHCPDGSDEWGCLKIDNNTKQLQVRSSEGRWSNVCGDKWTSQWTDLVCEQLGLGVSVSTEVKRVTETVPIPRVKLSPDAQEISRRGRAPLQYFFDHGECANDPLVHISCKQPQCGMWSYTAPNVIPHGEKNFLDVWPSLGLLVQPEAYADKTVAYTHSCSASVITSTWILASHSCLASKHNGFNAETWALLVGEKFPKVGADSTQLRYAKQIVVYPGAKRIRGLWVGDAALLRLRTPLLFDSSTEPICLSNEPAASHDHCVIVSWKNYDKGNSEGELGRLRSQSIQNLPVPNLTLNTCNTSYYNGNLKKGQVCASFLQGKRSSCVGHEGSPLMCRKQDKTWYLQGLMSHVGHCANFNLPSVFTDVSSIQSWVMRTIGRHPTEEPSSKQALKIESSSPAPKEQVLNETSSTVNKDETLQTTNPEKNLLTLKPTVEVGSNSVNQSVTHSES